MKPISVLVISFEQKKQVREKFLELGVKESKIMNMVCDPEESKDVPIYFSIYSDMSFGYTPIDSEFVKDLSLINIESLMSLTKNDLKSYSYDQVKDLCIKAIVDACRVSSPFGHQGMSQNEKKFLDAWLLENL